MSAEERLPWFKCIPSLLLGALVEMEAEEQLVYVTTLLRIYEVNGPIPDEPKRLALRTHLSLEKVEAALKELIEAGKLVRTADGRLMNPVAEAEIATARELSETRRRSSRKRWDDGASSELPLGDASALQMDTHRQEQGHQQEERGEGARGAPAPAPARKRATRIAEDWKPSERNIADAKKLGLFDTEIERQARRFRDFWLAKSGEGGTKLDWDATWRNWCDKEAERLGRAPRPPDGSAPSPVAGKFYARAGSEELEAWDAHNRAAHGKPLPRDPRGGWHVAAQWPPGYQPRPRAA